MIFHKNIICVLKTFGLTKYFAHKFYTASYRCNNRSCTWNNYKKNTDWGFYSKDDDDCDSCRMKCTLDPMCGAVECGKGYCSWWKVGKCRSSSEQNGYANSCYKRKKDNLKHYSDYNINLIVFSF